MAEPSESFLPSEWNAGSEWRSDCQVNWSVPRAVSADWLYRDQRVMGAFGLFHLPRLLTDLPAQPVVRQVIDLPDDGCGAVWFESIVKVGVGREPQVMLKVQSRLMLTCQRCLQPMLWEIDEQAVFEVVRANHAQARSNEQVSDPFDPAEPEELLVDGEFDLRELIEDQIILAVPYVPRHRTCKTVVSLSEQQAVSSTQSPFEVLGRLKRTPR